jgi:hypothetical protein
MGNINYALIFGALVESSTTTFIGENHIKALLSMTQEQLDKVFGFKTIRMLTDAFVAVAKKKNIPLYYNNEYGVEEDIFTWMPNAQVVDGEGGGVITMLSKNTTEKEILETALKLPLSQAIERMTAELRGGYFSKNLKWLVIYLTDTNTEGVPLLLICYLDDSLLNLYVEVDPGNAWSVDDDYEVGFLSNIA